MRWPHTPRIPDIPIHVLQGVPVLGCILGYLSTIGELKIGLLVVSVAVSTIAFGEMVRRAEAAASEVRQIAAQLGDMHSVGNGNPQATMRAAARWGSDVLGRVARGENAAEAVAGVALVEMADGQSDSESTVSEQELNGFHTNGYEPRSHSSWIYNAMRSVTPESVTPRDIARMGTVPEDIPYHGQPLAKAHPPARRAHCSPARVSAAAAAT